MKQLLLKLGIIRFLEVTVYSYNYCAPAQQVHPYDTYSPALGRAPRNLAEAAKEGWYTSRCAAYENPARVVAPPFEGTPSLLPAPKLYRTTVKVDRNGNFDPNHKYQPVTAVH